MNQTQPKPSSAIVADALSRDLTLYALAAMPSARLERLAGDLTAALDRIDTVMTLRTQDTL